MNVEEYAAWWEIYLLYGKFDHNMAFYNNNLVGMINNESSMNNIQTR